MPTLLDFLGFENWLNHNLGASLLRSDSPWFELDKARTTTITQDLPGVRLELDSKIVFKADGPTIEIDGRSIVATNEGLTLTNAIFALKFDESGNLVGFRDGELLDEFLADTVEGMWVGVSTNDRFNARLVSGEPSKLAFFAGCFDEDGLVAKPLWWRERLAGSEVIGRCGFDERD